MSEQSPIADRRKQIEEAFVWAEECIFNLMEDGCILEDKHRRIIHSHVKQAHLAGADANNAEIPRIASSLSVVRKSLERIGAHAGHPDAAEGCRLIVKAVKEVLAQLPPTTADNPPSPTPKGDE